MKRRPSRARRERRGGDARREDAQSGGGAGECHRARGGRLARAREGPREAPVATPGGRVVGFLNERAGRRHARTRAARHRDSSHCHEQRARDLEISRRAVLWIERPPRRPPRLRRALRRHSASRALVPPRTEHALDGGRAAGVFRAAVRPSPARRAPGIAAPRPGSSPPRLAVAVASRGGGSPARRPPPSRRRVRARRSPPRATRRPPRRPSLRARLANRRGARDRGGGCAPLG